VNGQVVGTHLGAWTPFEIDISHLVRDENELVVTCTDCNHTTNGFLPVLGVRWTGARDIEVRSEPLAPRPPARQRSSTRGTQFLIDGRPFRVRGILHWGYYPELQQPWPTESMMRAEIAYVRSLGFNLIKFCLWIPPPRYYELCEELGMLVWQEYPVWDAPLNDPAIKSEYADFFRQDGPFSCIVLRTLTCDNDRVDPILGRELIDLCHKLVPGSVVLDNSAWLCAERAGDFHDEHPYLNNIQWRYYGRRMRGKLIKPLLLGETIIADSLADGPHDIAMSVRRFQIETLACDLPDAGYVINSIRDVKNVPMGLQNYEGRPKFTPEQWSWHRDPLVPPRTIRDVAGPIIGPRKGQWKCPEYTWWSPIIKVLDPTLPVELIEREAVFDLQTGRVLDRCENTRILVEVWDVHSGKLRKLPVIVEFMSNGRRQVVSAFRHDTPVGQELWAALMSRTGDAPEIGAVIGTSIVLEDWQMSLDDRTWIDVKCDTPLVNGGRNVFEGWATFRTQFDYPGGKRTLRCEAVCDYYEFFIDGHRIAEAGPRNGTWDGTRDVPRNYELDLSPGHHKIEFQVRDWRAAGGMVGPVYIAGDLNERVF
jgi:hypothetical protein